MKKKFTFGTDPEFFGKEKESGKYKCMIPFLSGTKHEPEILPSGAGLQRDNVALEFASNPVTNEIDLVNDLRKAFTEIVAKIPKHIEIVAESSANFDEKELVHPEAREFGCSPDYDAYVPKINPPASCDDPTFRSCGAHIHLGYVKGSGNDFLLDGMGKVNTVLAMDAIIGIVSVVLDNSEASIKRRQLYGKAGCHRPTNYGVEYRTLSNYWMKSPELAMLMYRLSEDVLQLMREDKASALIESIGKYTIKSVIDEGKFEEATKIMNEKIRPILSAKSSEMLDICLEKVEGYVFAKEWKLNEMEVSV